MTQVPKFLLPVALLGRFVYRIAAVSPPYLGCVDRDVEESRTEDHPVA